MHTCMNIKNHLSEEKKLKVIWRVKTSAWCPKKKSSNCHYLWKSKKLLVLTLSVLYVPHEMSSVFYRNKYPRTYSQWLNTYGKEWPKACKADLIKGKSAMWMKQFLCSLFRRVRKQFYKRSKHHLKLDRSNIQLLLHFFVNVRLCKCRKELIKYIQGQKIISRGIKKNHFHKIYRKNYYGLGCIVWELIGNKGNNIYSESPKRETDFRICSHRKRTTDSLLKRLFHNLFGYKSQIMNAQFGI